MNEGLRLLLQGAPQPASTVSSDGVASGIHRLPKKKPLVRVACNNCRTKRTACSGKRPSCARCVRFGLDCQYVSSTEGETRSAALKANIDRLQNQLQEHSDLLEHLRTAPEAEAIAVIRKLKTSPNASSVLGSLKGNASTATRPSLLRAARGSMPSTSSGLEFELSMLHGAVYPVLMPLDLRSINVEALLDPGLRRSPRLRAALQSPEESGMNSSVTASSSRWPHTEEGPLPLSDSAPEFRLCDDRLRRLQIDYWTRIPVGNVLAARAISLYLEVDHPILGFFDADLFLGDLVQCQLNHCSSFLVGALLYLMCQRVASGAAADITLTGALYRETERLWQADQFTDSATTVSAIMLFGFACTMHGKEGIVLTLFEVARKMAQRMCLFDVPHDLAVVSMLGQLSPIQIRERSHAAWGTYNWLSTHSMFFHKEPILFPPILPIPGDSRPSAGHPSGLVWPPHPLPSYMGLTFPSQSRFWRIVQEILVVYLAKDDVPLPERVPLAFAEAKYQKILSWADTLSEEMRQGEHSVAHALVFYTIFHGVVLDIFRPFLQHPSRHQLRSFSSPDSSPNAIFEASFNQLKRIMFLYTSQPQLMHFTPLLGPAVVHLNSVLLQSSREATWRFYFLICINYSKRATKAYPVFAGIAQAHLTMAMRRGIITTKEAQAHMEEVRRNGEHYVALDEAMTSCIADFDLAMTAPDEATINTMAQRFDDLAIFNEFTVGGYDDSHDTPK